MAKLTRVTGKTFGATATATGDNPQIGQFGSGKAGTYVGTTDVATIQGLTAWSNGFIDSVTPDKQYPPLPEVTGAMKVLSYQENYLLQQGVAEWDSATDYYINGFCSYNGVIYKSLADNNLNNNPSSSTANWEVYFQSTINGLANKDLSNLSATGENHFSNPNLSNLTSTGEARLHALKSYKDAGELLTDPDGLAFVKNYAHSTFDLSKFTVVGSPNITDDGIASGFSNSNFLKLLYTPSTHKYTFNIKYKPTTSTSVDGYVLGYWSQFIQIYTNGANLYFYVGNTSENIQIGDWIPLALNSEYDITFDADFISGTATVNYTKDGESMTPLTTTISGTPKENTELFIGFGTNIGSIDLKQFSIIVDGVEVFSGNKTGIDTIKLDNYTINGTPTISADGVASEFSSSNYLYSLQNISVSSTNSFVIESPLFKVPQNSVSNGIFSIYGTDTNTGFFALLNSGNIQVIGKANGSDVIRVTSSQSISANTWYQIRIVGNGTNLTAQYKEANSSEWTTIGSPSTTSFTMDLKRLQIGWWLYATAFSGSQDLNAFKIYTDGDLVYQPCLKIPYTESKTGSKIVSSTYRDRVADMSAQFGFANYYTLSDTDFTLPQVELYGLIENRLDVNMATQTEKNTIIGWCIPDYSKAIAVNYTSGDAVGFDGWLAFNGSVSGLALSGWVAINYIKFCANYRGNQDGGGADFSGLAMVKSTDLITFANATGTFYKIPFSGGN